MSEQKSYPRPRQVTTAAILGAVGGALLVLSLFDSASRLRTVEMRDAVEEFLAEPPGDGLGISVSWVLDALHVVMLLNGALAAVATVLAVYLFWGHGGARIGFTVTAGILVFTSPFSGGVLAVLLAIAAVMLWSRPAREWFAGRDPAVPTADEMFTARRREQPDPSWAPPSARQDRPDPAAWSRDRQHPDDHAGTAAADDTDEQEPSRPEDSGPEQRDRPSDRPAPAMHRFGEVRQRWEPPASQPNPAPVHPATGRPAAVVGAALLTWALTSLVLFVFAVTVAMLMGAQDALLDSIAQDPAAATLDMSTADLLALLWVVSAVIIFWCLCAAALGVLVLRRQGWARVMLTVSCVMTVLVSAAVGVTGMNLLVALVCMVYVVAAGVTIALLYTRRSSDWFSGHGATRGQPPYGGPGGSGGRRPGDAPGWTPPQGQPQGPPRRPSGKPPVW